jgi:hypothetical protein
MANTVKKKWLTLKTKMFLEAKNRERTRRLKLKRKNKKEKKKTLKRLNVGNNGAHSLSIDTVITSLSLITSLSSPLLTTVVVLFCYY